MAERGRPTGRGALYAWGANSYGQLGLGAKSEQEEAPVPLDCAEMEDGIECLAGGGGHSLLVDGRGTLWACGWNSRGQLGIGCRNNNVTSFVPVSMPTTSRVTKVSCGWDFSVVLTESGSVWGCGSNTFGQLGMGEECKGVDGLAPIPGLDDIVDIACGLRKLVVNTISEPQTRVH